MRLSWRLIAVCAGPLLGTLLGASAPASAEGACSNELLKDVFVQGGQQVIEDSHLSITSLSRDEEVSQKDGALTCRYLMELSDHSKKWVRFTYTVDESGQAAIDYEEEAHNTSR